jgi:FdhD protein
MAGDTEIEGPGYQERPALRHRGADGADGKDGAYVAVRVIDRVAEEAPVALVFNGISHAVMMATPCELEAFALGFALTEGLVAARAEVFDIEVRQLARGFEVELTIAQQNFMQLKQQRRSMAGRSGCGVCGIESIEPGAGARRQAGGGGRGAGGGGARLA